MSGAPDGFVDVSDLTDEEREHNSYLLDASPPFPVRVVAAKLWADLINTPGSNGEQDPYRKAFAGMLIDKIIDGAVDVDDKRRAFAKSIVENGVRVLRHTSAHGREPHQLLHVLDRLDVDYHPSLFLHAAAMAAGIDVNRVFWPMKTGTRLTPMSVCASLGYRAPHLYHYPLADGRVLVAPDAFSDRAFIEYIASIPMLPGGNDLAPGCTILDWRWTDYAAELGVGDGAK